MALRPEAAGPAFPPVTYAVGREGVRAYALAVGATDPLHLDVAAARAAGFPDVVAPPMFAAVHGLPAVAAARFDPALGLHPARTAHLAQAFTWHRLVVAGDELTTTVHLARAEPGRCVLATASVDQHGELVATGSWSYGARESEAPVAPPAATAPARTATPDRLTAVRYAGAAGDFDPVHLDPGFARAVGLPGVVLHPLWTLAQVAQAATEAGPGGLRGLEATFGAPAVPGAPLEVRTAPRAGGLDLTVTQAGAVVVPAARAELHPV